MSSTGLAAGGSGMRGPGGASPRRTWPCRCRAAAESDCWARGRPWARSRRSHPSRRPRRSRRRLSCALPSPVRHAGAGANERTWTGPIALSVPSPAPSRGAETAMVHPDRSRSEVGSCGSGEPEPPSGVGTDPAMPGRSPCGPESRGCRASCCGPLMPSPPEHYKVCDECGNDGGQTFGDAAAWDMSRAGGAARALCGILVSYRINSPLHTTTRYVQVQQRKADQRCFLGSPCSSR